MLWGAGERNPRLPDYISTLVTRNFLIGFVVFFAIFGFIGGTINKYAEIYKSVVPENVNVKYSSNDENTQFSIFESVDFFARHIFKSFNFESMGRAQDRFKLFNLGFDNFRMLLFGYYDLNKTFNVVSRCLSSIYKFYPNLGWEKSNKWLIGERYVSFNSVFHGFFSGTELTNTCHGDNQGGSYKNKLESIFEVLFRILSFFIAMFWCRHVVFAIHKFLDSVSIKNFIRQAMYWCLGAYFMFYAVIYQDGVTVFYSDPSWQKWLKAQIPIFMIASCVMFVVGYVSYNFAAQQCGCGPLNLE